MYESKVTISTYMKLNIGKRFFNHQPSVQLEDSGFCTKVCALPLFYEPTRREPNHPLRHLQRVSKASRNNLPASYSRGISLASFCVHMYGDSACAHPRTSSATGCVRCGRPRICVSARGWVFVSVCASVCVCVCVRAAVRVCIQIRFPHARFRNP